MSTAKIREALGTLGFSHDVSGAIAELEAIEKMAVTLEHCQIGYSRGVTRQAEADAAYAVILSIAAQRNAGTAGAAGPKDGA